MNSAGLTDFNPDLRDALACNVDSATNLIGFLRQCDHAGLMHLSTCYVVGMRDGRVDEELHDNYNPPHDKDFSAAEEIESLREMIRNVEERAQSPEITKGLQRQALGRGADASKAPAAELDGVLKRNRTRWAKNRLTRAGTRRAQHWAGRILTRSRKASANRCCLGQGAGFADRRGAAFDRGNFHAICRFAAGTKASTPRRRFPICWAHISASCRPTSASAWT